MKIDSFVQWETRTNTATGRIKKIIKDGKVPHIKTDIIATPTSPAALIEVWRDGNPSGDYVGIKCDLLKLMPDEYEQDSGNNSYLTQDQLDKINRYCGAAVGMEPIKEYEMKSVSFVVADNLVNRGLGKWVESDLRKMTRLCLGIPFTLDHDWYDVKKSQGFIYDSRVIKLNPTDKLIDQAGNLKRNKLALEQENQVIQAIIDVAFPWYSSALDAIRFGQVGKVSLGGFGYKDLWCPLCDTSFEDEKCPHGVPDPMWGITDEIDPRIAPYYIRKDIYDVGEVSLVLIPNLPNAGVVKTQN